MMRLLVEMLPAESPSEDEPGWIAFRAFVAALDAIPEEHRNDQAGNAMVCLVGIVLSGLPKDNVPEAVAALFRTIEGSIWDPHGISLVPQEKQPIRRSCRKVH